MLQPPQPPPQPHVGADGEDLEPEPARVNTRHRGGRGQYWPLIGQHAQYWALIGQLLKKALAL